MLRGAPEAANSATACASPAASGWPVARTFARRVSRSAPGMLSQTRVSASSGPLSSSAAAAASTASQSQSASLGSGPWSQAASTARACGPTRGAAAISRQAGSASSPSASTTPTATLRSSGDIPSAAARISRAASAGWRSASHPHATWSRCSSSPNRAASAIISPAGSPGPPAGQAAARCPAAQRPSGVITGLPGSPATAPNPASSATSPASGFSLQDRHTCRPLATAPRTTCRICRTGHAAPEHRPPQAAGGRRTVLAQHREQRQRQQAHAVLVLRVRLRRAHRAQAREPSGQQVRIARRPALQRGAAGHPSAADLQQAGRDRDAPGPVQRPDVGHRPQPRRHVHAEGRARGRHVGLPQHLRRPSPDGGPSRSSGPA